MDPVDAARLREEAQQHDEKGRALIDGKRVTCRHCGGVGRIESSITYPGPGWSICPACGGRGWFRERLP